MIAAAAIVWAVLATGGAAAVYWLMAREMRDAVARADQADQVEAIRTAERDNAIDKAIRWGGQLFDTRCRLVEAIDARTDLEDRLRQIEQQRHNAAVKARAAQLAQQRAAVLAKAHEVAPQVERRAA